MSLGWSDQGPAPVVTWKRWRRAGPGRGTGAGLRPRAVTSAQFSPLRTTGHSGCPQSGACRAGRGGAAPVDIGSARAHSGVRRRSTAVVPLAPAASALPLLRASQQSIHFLPIARGRCTCCVRRRPAACRLRSRGALTPLQGCLARLPQASAVAMCGDEEAKKRVAEMPVRELQRFLDERKAGRRAQARRGGGVTPWLRPDCPPRPAGEARAAGARA
jgi:hypothetical protein